MNSRNAAFRARLSTEAQTARERALNGFRAGKIDILVATDVAARGIDVEGITHVINYNCPEDEKTYIHRIGRTGRAGASGIAVTFVDWADLTRWKTINKALDLPFEDPQETYSTSEHLFQDMGIPHDAKGRLIPAPPREPKAQTKPREQRGGSSRNGQSRSTESRSTESRDSQPKQRQRNRSRSRTRSGAPVAKSD